MISINKFLLFFLISYVSCEYFRFDNYKLFKILPENDIQYKILQDVQDNDSRYDFWSDPVPIRKFVNVMSSPGDTADLEGILKKNEIKYEIAMENIQEAIDKETVKTYTRNNIRSMEWNAYYNLTEINAWLDDLAAAYPNIVTIIIGGRSYEGRDIKGIKISHGSRRKSIFIESGIHAREWISPATTCYIINELLTNNNDAETRAAARDYDWYIFPVTNPDGYIWSHEQFRMWRKNRRPFGEHFGVDLNRNWNNNWLVSGSSTDPSTDIYAGPGPFSEPETRSLSSYIRSIGNIELYIATHSFGQLLLLPFGNSTAPYGNYHDAMRIGRRAMGALSVRYGTQYITGNIAEAIYMATGGSVDWVKEQVQVPLVYVYEFRDRGTHGFLLPPEQILPNSEETMDSLLEIIHQAKRFGYMNSSKAIHASLFVCLLALLISMF